MKGPNGRLQKVDRLVTDLFFWVKTIWMTNDPGTFLQHRIEKHDYFFLTFSRRDFRNTGGLHHRFQYELIVFQFNGHRCSTFHLQTVESR